MSAPLDDDLRGSPYVKPRAIILDLYGDYLRYAEGEVKAGDLVALLGLFGVEPAAVRVTLSRLRREGWFVTRRAGRETVYELSATLLGVLEEGRVRIFAPYAPRWDRTWTTIVYRSGLDRPVREEVRKRLSWLGFGPLSSSTWLSPWDRSSAAAELAAEFPELELTVLRSATADAAADRALAERCWDLPEINRLYREFLAVHASLRAGAASLGGAEALVARTVLVDSYRRFPFVDPWLPAEVHPADWLGGEANALFAAAHRALGPAAREVVAGVVGVPIGSSG